MKLVLPPAILILLTLVGCASPQKDLGKIVWGEKDAVARYTGENKWPNNETTIKIIDDLLASGADINTPANKQEETVLYICMKDYIYSRKNGGDKYCDIEIMRFLLSRGADPKKLHIHFGEWYYQDAFSYLVSYTKDKAIYDLFFLEFASEQDVLNAAKDAARFGNDFALRYFIEEVGMPVDSNIGNGFTPLIQAATNGHLSTVEMLLNLGADPDMKSPWLKKDWRELLQLNAQWTAERERKAIQQAERSAAERAKKKRFWAGVNKFIGSAAESLSNYSSSTEGSYFSDDSFESSIQSTYNQTLSQINQLERKQKTTNQVDRQDIHSPASGYSSVSRSSASKNDSWAAPSLDNAPVRPCSIKDQNCDPDAYSLCMDEDSRTLSCQVLETEWRGSAWWATNPSRNAECKLRTNAPNAVSRGSFSKNSGFISGKEYRSDQPRKACLERCPEEARQFQYKGDYRCIGT